ncbi:MAG: pyruvate ferredoxin oxidoreductase [Acidobacteria bacterium]|nr:pyruvate ferredoxin oxidoreductase [Acidobacteriota bacterium]
MSTQSVPQDRADSDRSRKEVVLSGNMAVAHALRQVDPHVFPGYPITPSTKIMEMVASFIANGEMQCELVAVESEHSALSVAVGAAAAGARVASATSSQGLAFMWEMLYIAAGSQLPMVLAVGNRALSAPINGFSDHGEAMGARDSGWLQFHSESVQETYDNIVQAFRIGEDRRVRLPVMVCLDGFVLTHTSENIFLENDEAIRNFVRPYRTEYTLLNPDRPVSYGLGDPPEFYMEHKMRQQAGMERALQVIEEVGAEFGRCFGRHYGLLDPYRMEDAEVAIVILGSEAGRVKNVVDELRASGKKAGVLRIRFVRPFPDEQIVKHLLPLRAVAVMDRSYAPGAVGAPVFQEIRSSLYEYRGGAPHVINRIYGLGGRELRAADVRTIFSELDSLRAGNESVPAIRLVGLRGEPLPNWRDQQAFKMPVGQS